MVQNALKISPVGQLYKHFVANSWSKQETDMKNEEGAMRFHSLHHFRSKVPAYSIACFVPTELNRGTIPDMPETARPLSSLLVLASPRPQLSPSTHMHTHTHTHPQTHTHIHTHTYIYTHTHTQAHTHTRTHAHTHTRTHIHNHLFDLLSDLLFAYCYFPDYFQTNSYF